MEQTLFAKEIQEIIGRVDLLRAAGKCPVVIGLDGMAASGKTTLAGLLERELDAAVIHMDDFFLPQGFRTPERLRTPGGNVYHERFRKEVVPFLRCGDLFGYRVFDAHGGGYTETRIVEPKPVILVEGCYCMHPSFGDIYDLKLFAEVSPYEQMKRIRETRPTRADMFKAMWIPMENLYHQECEIREHCDLVITSGAPQPEPPLEIERKFLIRMPDIHTLNCHTKNKVLMEQIYLKGGAPGSSMRIRRSEDIHGVRYHKNEKRRITDMVRVEYEEEITEKEFNILRGFADPKLSVISKSRWYVPIGELMAEIDLFPFWTDRAFCEVELPSVDTEFTLPDWMEVIREVTEDKRYTNLALAKEIPMEEI